MRWWKEVTEGESRSYVCFCVVAGGTWWVEVSGGAISTGGGDSLREAGMQWVAMARFGARGGMRTVYCLLVGEGLIEKR